jgi:medium-chain acyl-[acyl-carrier-protein] hydrolase
MSFQGALPTDWIPVCRFRSMGGTPDEILESNEMMEAIVYPVVRADWSALDTYDIKQEEPLDVKVTVLRGRDDHLATEEQQRTWSTHAKTNFEFVTLPGGHFFLKTEAPELLELIVNRIQSSIAC